MCPLQVTPQGDCSEVLWQQLLLECVMRCCHHSPLYSYIICCWMPVSRSLAGTGDVGLLSGADFLLGLMHVLREHGWGGIETDHGVACIGA